MQQEHVKFQDKLKADRAKMDADLARTADDVAKYKDCVDDKDMVGEAAGLWKCGRQFIPEVIITFSVPGS